MDERRDGLLNFHAGVIFQKGRVHDDGDDKSISTGDAVSVGCWKNEKTRNRIPLLMELMDTRVFEVHWKAFYNVRGKCSIVYRDRQKGVAV